MIHTLKTQLAKLKGARAVKFNRFFHAFFMLGKKEERASEKVCRDPRPYNYVDYSRY